MRQLPNYENGRLIMKPIRFEILKESWNTWRLSDGILLRVRPQLVWAIETGRPSGAGQLRTSLGIGAITPEDLHRDPTPGGTSLVGRTPAKEYLSTEWALETPGESLYLLENGSMVRLSLALQKVLRYDVYDQNREPVVQAFAITEILFQQREPPGAETEANVPARPAPTQ